MPLPELDHLEITDSIRNVIRNHFSEALRGPPAADPPHTYHTKITQDEQYRSEHHNLPI
jgi:hypothetical protein